jgi:hypothetical protein
MSIDAELTAWQREWREQTPPTISADELGRTVRRGNRNALYGTVAAALFTIVAVVPLLRRAAQGEVELRFLMGILTFIALVWISALLLGRGTWRPRDETTAAFLDVSIRRCRAAMLAVPVAAVLYCAELLYVLLSTHRLDGASWGEMLRSTQFILVGWIGGPLYIGGQLWYARRQQQRLVRLRQLQSQLAGTG